MGNTKKSVSVAEFENLSKKVDVLSNLLKVCQSDDKLCHERLDRLEITCDLLKKNDIVLKEYSICYPNDEDEPEQDQDEKQSHNNEEEIPDKESHGMDIEELKVTKENYLTEITNLEEKNS